MFGMRDVIENKDRPFFLVQNDVEDERILNRLLKKYIIYNIICILR